ncbi:MAG: hypothetical protein ACLFU8_06750 [Anaerolineales bacterium]
MKIWKNALFVLALVAAFFVGWWAAGEPEAPVPPTAIPEPSPTSTLRPSPSPSPLLSPTSPPAPSPTLSPLPTPAVEYAVRLYMPLIMQDGNLEGP